LDKLFERQLTSTDLERRGEGFLGASEIAKFDLSPTMSQRTLEALGSSSIASQEQSPGWGCILVTGTVSYFKDPVLG